MVNTASKSAFDFLVRKSNELSVQHPGPRDWRASPFDWLLALPSGSRGAIARRFVEDWANEEGLNAHQVSDTRQRYVVVNGHRVQVKMSTLWANGTYKFQQIRDQDYEYTLCLGISPNDVHAWLIPKNELLIHLDGVAGQHTGASARETHWLQIDPARSDRWLSNFGNQLSDVRELLKDL